MKAVLLDCNSLGPDDLDLSALMALPVDWTIYPETSDREVCERIVDADIVLTNKVPINALSLSQAPRLKIISVMATGTNAIDLQAAAQHQVAVCNAVKYGTGSVVQHVWALILALTTKLADYQRAAVDGTWQHSSQFCLLNFPVEELQSKVLGIVGAGELGRGVAKVAEAFGLEVIYAALPGRQYADQQRVDFEAFLSRADIVSLHCPLTAETTNLIDEVELALMKPSAVLINTARGGMVNEAALKRALLNGAIAGAGIDVLTNEPPREGNPLLDETIPNLIVTPHCAWVARQSRQRLVAQAVENVRAFLQEEPLPRAVVP
ncbi:D-2-hydroxyacid dehydrogenase [SAR92 clade bacterium H455]|uniref:D-2-hydroxyacid dehydrogenase n=1 Tax=SAR92 clade bacterium H455 TaxID=2974818 RepID=A0ABY5TNA3_9GAMM|nr:D-2-hydroxyacid dehydrogenase [SAR92 clade bacterium H455]